MRRGRSCFASECRSAKIEIAKGIAHDGWTFGTILPRDSVQFEIIAAEPGAFLVHCGTPPVLMHLMQGMYMAMIVDPP